MAGNGGLESFNRFVRDKAREEARQEVPQQKMQGHSLRGVFVDEIAGWDPDVLLVERVRRLHSALMRPLYVLQMAMPAPTRPGAQTRARNGARDVDAVVREYVASNLGVEELALAIARGYEPGVDVVNDHDRRAARSVLALIRGGEA